MALHLRNLAAVCAAGFALAIAGSSGGCSAPTRHRVLSTLFDGVPPLGAAPPERRRPPGIARVAPQSAAVPASVPPAIDVAPPPPSRAVRLHFESYEALAAAAPKDAAGAPDWVAAVRDGLIDPRPSPDPNVKPLPAFPLEVRLDPGIPNFEVVFPHATHTYWLRCESCHPQIFQMKAGANPITMAAIFQGEFCGRCHGKVAFAPATSCARCHTALARMSP